MTSSAFIIKLEMSGYDYEWNDEPSGFPFVNNGYLEGILHSA